MYVYIRVSIGSLRSIRNLNSSAYHKCYESADSIECRKSLLWLPKKNTAPCSCQYCLHLTCIQNLHAATKLMPQIFCRSSVIPAILCLYHLEVVAWRQSELSISLLRTHDSSVWRKWSIHNTDQSTCQFQLPLILNFIVQSSGIHSDAHRQINTD
jgi:hypothetical protein